MTGHVDSYLLPPLTPGRILSWGVPGSSSSPSAPQESVPHRALPGALTATSPPFPLLEAHHCLPGSVPHPCDAHKHQTLLICKACCPPATIPYHARLSTSLPGWREVTSPGTELTGLRGMTPGIHLLGRTAPAPRVLSQLEKRIRVLAGKAGNTGVGGGGGGGREIGCKENTDMKRELNSPFCQSFVLSDHH